MSDFTIIIPHHVGQLHSMGLWATVHSCDADLERTKFNYNYVIATNGGAVPQEVKVLLEHLKANGKLKEHVHTDEVQTAQSARQNAAEVADGQLLFFFDNHCLVNRQYFERAVLDFEKYGMDMLHSTTCFYTADGLHYHYRLKLNYNFWAESSKIPYLSWKPYKLAAGGHGGFVVSKKAWDDVGGYGPVDNLLSGYAGEELLFDLKMWRFGKTNWIDPKLVHYHYTGPRGYNRHFTDEYYTNLLVGANVIGGEKWVYKVLNSFITKPHLRISPKLTWFEVLELALKKSAEHARYVDSRSTRTLDELLVWFKQNEVAM